MSIPEKKRIILLCNPAKPQAVQMGREMVDWLAPRAQIITDNINHSCDLAHLPPADFIIVLGGDGTILSTVRGLGLQQLPVIGVNMGKLGFLAEFSIDQFRENFDEIISRPELISRRMMLNCRVVRPRGEDFQVIAVNDVVVIAGPPFRMIDLSISIADEHLAFCTGDGLIVATPTGSTAYNLSAGGPILASGIEVAVITPLAAHSLGFRPIVVDLAKPIVLSCPDSRLRFEQTDSQQVKKHESAVMVIDGQDNLALGRDDKVIITRANSYFQLVQNPRQSQWSLLNTKLNWGTLPNYNGSRPNLAPR